MKFKKNRTPWNKGMTWNRTIIKCEICKKEKSVINSVLKFRSGRFCSAECRDKYFSLMPKVIKCKQCGKERKIHNGDKTSKFCSLQCYWKFMKGLYDGNLGNKYRMTTSFGRRTYVHRAIIEKKLGRKLLKTEIVHHKNFNREDNRINNLIVISQSRHIKLHMIYNSQPKKKQLSSVKKY